MENEDIRDKLSKLFSNPKTYIISTIICIGIWLLSLCITKVAPGEVGVVVNQLAENAIDDKELHVGIHFIKPWKTVYKFPIYEQNHQWTDTDNFNFQTLEGLAVNADIGITFNLEQNKIPQLFYKYRRGIDEITHVFIKNSIRDSMNRVASRMLIEDLYGSKKEEFFRLVHKDVVNELKPLGFNISRIFIIGKFNVPALVMEALNKKIEATQRAQQRENELRESEAQAKKEVAISYGKSQSKIIEAKATAEGNTIISKSLTPELLKWKTLDKWDGKLPTAMGGEAASFLIDLKNNR